VPVEPAQLVAALAGYGVPVELIDCNLTDGDAVVSALGMRAAARQPNISRAAPPFEQGGAAGSLLALFLFGQLAGSEVQVDDVAV
jgi:hypothetical protein